MSNNLIYTKGTHLEFYLFSFRHRANDKFDKFLYSFWCINQKQNLKQITYLLKKKKKKKSQNVQCLQHGFRHFDYNNIPGHNIACCPALFNLPHLTLIFLCQIYFCF